MSWYFYRTQRKDNFSSTQPPKEGLKPKVLKGKFNGKWWANRWLESLEQFIDQRKMTQGRTYARKGTVVSLEEKRGVITAQVKGERYSPENIKIKLKPLSEQKWEQILNKMAGKALFEAKLLNGELPQEIEEIFEEAGSSLFPKNSSDLEYQCSCKNQNQPCKHVAAVFYLLAERLDEEPFLLFKMRGKSREEVIEAIRKKGYKNKNSPETPSFDLYRQFGIEMEESLPDAQENYWEITNLPENWAISIRAPKFSAPVLRRLGPPPFLPSPLYEQLTSVFQEVGISAKGAAFFDLDENKLNGSK